MRTYFRSDQDSLRPHTLEAGDIIVEVYGQGQTCVSFWEIIRTSDNFAYLIPCGQSCKVTDEDSSAGLASPEPYPSELKGELEVIKCQANNGDKVTCPYGIGFKFTGEPVHYCYSPGAINVNKAGK